MLLNTINSTFASALDIAMYIMVLGLEGNSEQPLLTKFVRFMAALNLNKCLTQIKYPRSLYTCEPISGLLANISTMINIVHI